MQSEIEVNEEDLYALKINWKGKRTVGKANKGINVEKYNKFKILNYKKEKRKGMEKERKKGKKRKTPQNCKNPT